MKPVSAQQCDFCTRCFPRACEAAIHEASCKRNPARRNCITCTHGYKYKMPVESDCPGLSDYTVDRSMCGYHDLPISEKPYFIDSDIYQGSPYWDEDEAQPIPGTCGAYSYKGWAGWGKPVAERRKPASEDD